MSRFIGFVKSAISLNPAMATTPLTMRRIAGVMAASYRSVLLPVIAEHPELDLAETYIECLVRFVYEHEDLLNEIANTDPRSQATLEGLFDEFEMGGVRLLIVNQQSMDGYIRVPQSLIASNAGVFTAPPSLQERGYHGVCIVKGWMRTISDEEKRYVFGHECGHIACDHTMESANGRKIRDVAKEQQADMWAFAHGASPIAARSVMRRLGFLRRWSRESINRRIFFWMLSQELTEEDVAKIDKAKISFQDAIREKAEQSAVRLVQ